MKISGAEQVNIMGMTPMELRLNEDRAIERTTRQLSDEGKTVINIIHGTPMTGVGSTHKTLTFLWEGDDADSRYIAAKERKAKAIAKEREIKQLEEERADLEKRIKAAQTTPPINKESASFEVKTRGFLWLIIGVVILLAGYQFFKVVCYGEFNISLILFVLAGGVFCYGGIKSFTDPKMVTDEMKEQEQIMQDQANLSQLQEQLHEKELEIIRIQLS